MRFVKMISLKLCHLLLQIILFQLSNHYFYYFAFEVYIVDKILFIMIIIETKFIGDCSRTQVNKKRENILLSRDFEGEGCVNRAEINSFRTNLFSFIPIF